MSAFTRFLGRLFGGKKPADRGAPPKQQPFLVRRSRYDAADTSDENKNHWGQADSLSANAANSSHIRTILRNRSRYERANNGYAKGLIRGRTNDTIGTGPRLQLDIPETVYDPDMQRPVAVFPPGTTPADLARQIEKRWNEWCESISATDKLRVLADAEDTDGEGLAVFTDRDTDFPVRLGLRVLECDRLTTPDLFFEDDGQIDGIVLNAAGEPVEYHILRTHPGDTTWGSGSLEYDTYPARQVVHLFECDRPEQYRGIPILTPALPLYSVLRRFTLASLGAAEVGAMIAGVIENQNLPPDASGDDAPEFDSMDAVPFARNALLTLPGGATAKAFDSKQPAPGYREFKGEVLTEAGRAAGEMRNTATGSSAEYNYSSGRLDHLPRQRGIEIRRERWERALLDRMFLAWYAEARLIPDYLPAGLPEPEAWEWRWHWDGFPSIDPEKDAKAAEIEKRIGHATDAERLAKKGVDWREHYRQLAREKALRQELGIEPAPPPAPVQSAPPPDEDEEDDDEESTPTEGDEEEEEAANG